MNISSSVRYALCVSGAVAIFAGCGGSPQTQFNPTEPSQSAAGSGLQHRQSWIAPDAKKLDQLLYVSSNQESIISIYTYPGGKLKGEITLGLMNPQGMCVNKQGDLFVPNAGRIIGPNGYHVNWINEYAHGGTTRIAILYDQVGVGGSCSIDPVTGNLAVANIQGIISDADGNVVIYPNASGTPTTYTVPGMAYPYNVAYDNNGDLFVDGQTSLGSGFMLAELARGGSSFSDITLDQPIAGPGGVQWDGRYLVIGDEGSDVTPQAIYRFSISDSRGTKKGETQLEGPTAIVFDVVLGFWIDKKSKSIIGPNAGNPWFYIYKYPAGGEPIKSIKTTQATGYYGNNAAVLSQAPH